MEQKLSGIKFGIKKDGICPAALKKKHLKTRDKIMNPYIQAKMHKLPQGSGD